MATQGRPPRRRDRLPPRAADGQALRAGMSPDEARRAARLKFGGVEQVREATRDELRGAWLRDFGRDLRIAFRGLARVPSFSVTAILTIGLGIGAAAAMFTRRRRRAAAAAAVPGRRPHRAAVPDRRRTGRAAATSPSPTSSTGRRRRAASRRWPRPRPTDADRHRRRRAAVACGSRACRRASSTCMGTRPARGRGFLPEELQPGAAEGGAGRGALLGALARRRGRWPASRSSSAACSTRSSASCPTGSTTRSRPRCGLPREQDGASPSRTAHNFRVVARVKPGRRRRGGLGRAEPRVARAEGALRRARRGCRTPSPCRSSTCCRPASGRRCGCCSPRRSCCCSSPAPTSRTCWWRAPSSRRREFAVQLAHRRVDRTHHAPVAGRDAGRRHLRRRHRRRARRRSRARVRRARAGKRAAARSGVDRLGVARLRRRRRRRRRRRSSACSPRGARRRVRIADALSDSSRTGSGSRRQMRGREALIVAQVALTMVLLAGAGLLARSFAHAMAVDPGFRVGDDLVLSRRQSS